MKEKIILIGGFCEMIELCQECGFEIVGIVDQKDKDAVAYGLPYLGGDDAFLQKKEAFLKYPLVITPDAPRVRERIVKRYQGLGFSFAQVISPGAKISRTAKLGTGVVIQSGCMISARATIGDFARFNIGAHMFHESDVGAYTTLAPGALLLGRAKIGAKCYLGARSVILPGKGVGSCAMIGAGAVVTKDVEAGVTVVGVPARKMEQ